MKINTGQRVMITFHDGIQLTGTMVRGNYSGAVHQGIYEYVRTAWGGISRHEYTEITETEIKEDIVIYPNGSY